MFQSPPKLFIQANRASNAIYPGMAQAKCVTKAVALIAAIVVFYGVIRSHRSQLSNTQNRKVDSTPLPVPPLKVVDSPDRLLRHERISDTKDIPKIKDQNEKEGMKAPESPPSVKNQPSSKNTDSYSDRDIAKLAVKVTSSVRGNLGPPNVVINGKSNDWLKDRWQAAKNMQGVPIPGRHFIQLTFDKSISRITSITLDYETAFSKSFVVSLLSANKQAPDGQKLLLYSYESKHNICNINKPIDKSRKQHIKYTLVCNSQKLVEKIQDLHLSLNTFRLEMGHSTNWGVSLWNVAIQGRFEPH
eukprot:g74.t1